MPRYIIFACARAAYALMAARVDDAAICAAARDDATCLREFTPLYALMLTPIRFTRHMRF